MIIISPRDADRSVSLDAHYQRVHQINEPAPKISRPIRRLFSTNRPSFRSSAGTSGSRHFPHHCTILLLHSLTPPQPYHLTASSSSSSIQSVCLPISHPPRLVSIAFPDIKLNSLLFSQRNNKENGLHFIIHRPRQCDFAQADQDLRSQWRPCQLPCPGASQRCCVHPDHGRLQVPGLIRPRPWQGRAVVAVHHRVGPCPAVRMLQRLHEQHRQPVVR